MKRGAYLSMGDPLVGPTIGQRVDYVGKVLKIIIASSVPANDDDENDFLDRLESIEIVARTAYETLFWLTELSEDVLSLPALSADEIKRRNKAKTAKQ